MSYLNVVESIRKRRKNLIIKEKLIVEGNKNGIASVFGALNLLDIPYFTLSVNTGMHLGGSGFRLLTLDDEDMDYFYNKAIRMLEKEKNAEIKVIEQKYNIF